jgi:uncharacterized UPF0160 family protein
MTILGSHNGNFHADDVFAIAALTLLYPNYQILRSRDPKVWEKCDYLVDVGGVYDHEKRIYDHHFPNGPCHDDGLRMSSIGLVWKHYGEKICGNKNLAERVCNKLIRTLDAHDNGINISQKISTFDHLEDVSISSVVAAMNPPDLENVDQVFEQEVIKAAEVIKAYMANAKKWFASKSCVEKAFLTRKNKNFIEVEENCNWIEHLLEIDKDKEILFVLYPSDGKWYSRTVPINPQSYENRKSFPASWAGLRDEEFSKVVGIPDGIFCHHGRFICASASRESTIKLIQAALT